MNALPGFTATAGSAATTFQASIGALASGIAQVSGTQQVNSFLTSPFYFTDPLGANLIAGGDITFGSNSKITDANSWSVTLDAGYNFVNNAVQSGIGNIYLNGGNGLTGNGSILTGSGNINLTAGQDILLASQSSHQQTTQAKKISGSVFTTGGGSIFS